MSVINILMQLRKVCNHPDLFDPRPTVSPFRMDAIVFTTASLILRALDRDPIKVGCLFHWRSATVEIQETPRLTQKMFFFFFCEIVCMFALFCLVISAQILGTFLVRQYRIIHSFIRGGGWPLAVFRRAFQPTASAEA